MHDTLRLKAVKHGLVNTFDSNWSNLAMSGISGVFADVNPRTGRQVSTAASNYEPLDSGLDFKHGSD